MDINSLFETLNDKTIKKLEIEEIKEQLMPAMNGLEITTPIIRAGSYVYRARKIDGAFRKEAKICLKELSYPGTDKATLGRANRDNQSVFYCSLSKEPVFYEVPNLLSGDEIILSFWKTTKDIIVNNIGYTQKLFEELGVTRAHPTWSTKKVDQTGRQEIERHDNSMSDELLASIYKRDKNSAIREAMSKAFMCKVNHENNHMYKLTVAIVELHLEGTINHSQQFSGILYPSMGIGAEGDNLALLPEVADENLQFRKSVHIRIDNKENKKVNITQLDHANSFSKDKILQWLGRLPSWKGKQDVLATFKVGTDQDGDYITSIEGAPCHWVVTDKLSKNVIDPT